jgi:hypothetical protein
MRERAPRNEPGELSPAVLASYCAPMVTLSEHPFLYCVHQALRGKPAVFALTISLSAMKCRADYNKKTGRSAMRWLTLIAAGFVVGCSMMHPAPTPSRPTAQVPPAMMSRAAAEQVLTEDGYTSPALVPSQTYIGGWSGSAMRNGVKESVAVDKNGHVIQG